MCLERYNHNNYRKIINDNGNIILRKRFILDKEELFAYCRETRYKWDSYLTIEGWKYFAKRNNKMQNVEFAFNSTIGAPIYFYKKRILGYYFSYFNKSWAANNNQFSQLTYSEIKNGWNTVDLPIRILENDIQDFNDDAIVAEKFYLLSKEELIEFFNKYQKEVFAEDDLLTEPAIHSFANNYELILDKIGKIIYEKENK